MSTKNAELLAKVRAAKAAKAAGTVSEFVAESKQKRAAAPPSLPPSPARTTTPAPASVRPASGFASLVGQSVGDVAIEEDERDSTAHVPVVSTSPAASTAPTSTAPSTAAIPSPPISAPAPAIQVVARPSAAVPPAPSAAPASIAPPARNLVAEMAAHRARRAAEDANRAATATVQAVDKPDPEWGDARIPAGSNYSFEEWDAARDGGKYHVFEIRAQIDGCLMQVPKAPVTGSSAQKVMVGSKVTISAGAAPVIDLDSDEYMDPMSALLVDGCMLLGPKATTTHPAAATSLYTIRGPDGKDWPYRVTRPAAHRDDPSTSWLFGAKGQLPVVSEPWTDGIGSRPLAAVATEVEPSVDTVETDTETDAVRERMSG